MPRESNRPAAYELGRELDVHDALMLARRATFDPGQFTDRVRYDDDMETLERWQARAVLVALAAVSPDERWGTMEPHVTDFELDELKRVGLGRRVRTFRVHLADKPRDILVHLVEHGAMSPASLDRELGYQPGGLYAGGLTLLHELGLAHGPLNEHERIWSATEDGRRLVAEAKARAAAEEESDAS